VKLKNARFGPFYCRSYGDKKEFFSFEAIWVAQKTTSNIFLKNKKNCAMLDRSIPTREALVHSIPISEVKDMKSDVLRTLKVSLL
jgi:hypothetical protein